MGPKRVPSPKKSAGEKAAASRPSSPTSSSPSKSAGKSVKKAVGKAPAASAPAPAPVQAPAASPSPPSSGVTNAAVAKAPAKGLTGKKVLSKKAVPAPAKAPASAPSPSASASPSASEAPSRVVSPTARSPVTLKSAASAVIAGNKFSMAAKGKLTPPPPHQGGAPAPSSLGGPRALNPNSTAAEGTLSQSYLLPSDPPRTGLFIAEVEPTIHNTYVPAPSTLNASDPMAPTTFDPLRMPQHEVVQEPEDLTVANALDAKAAEHRLRLEGLKKTIADFYSVVAPERSAKAGEVAEKYLGNELRLFAQLESKYRYGSSDRDKRRRSNVSSPQQGGGRGGGQMVVPPPPVYPYGYLQKEFHKNITAFAIAHACRDQLVNNKMKEQRLVAASRAKAAASAAANNTAPPPTPKIKSREVVAKEVEAVTSMMSTDRQVSEMVRLAGLPLEKATTPSMQSLYGLTVWADVAIRTHLLAKAEREWDYRVTEYLKKRAEEEAFVHRDDNSRTNNSDRREVSFVGGGSQPSVSPSISNLGQGGGGGSTTSIGAGLEGGGALSVATAADGLSLRAPPPSICQQNDGILWQLIHEHHQRVRRSLFNGEAVMDELLPTGEASVKAVLDAPPTVPSTVLRACIASGYASTCDVTYRQQVQAFCLKYCPQHLPLVMPALWLYRGREHELIAKLHAEHGLDKTLQSEGGEGGGVSVSSTVQQSRKPSPKGRGGLNNTVTAPLSTSLSSKGEGQLSTAPSPLNSFPDPLVGSEIYLTEVMHGTVCGIGREVEYDSRFKLLKDSLTADDKKADPLRDVSPIRKKGKPPAKVKLGKDKAEGGNEDTSRGAKGNAAPFAALASALPMAYPCEDASFRSWSNIPPQLHATAHMARHFGLGPQVVHQLHAQNPLNPDACGYELLCALFPDAVYFCLDDDEQKVAFITKRVSELMSFVQVCDPTFTRPHRGMPEGSEGDGSRLPIAETIPRLFQKYSGLRDTLTDEQHERQAELDRIAVDTAGKYTRKPTKLFNKGGPNRPLNTADDDDLDDDFLGMRSGGGDEFGYRNRPERALADVFAQHFKKQLEAADQPAFPWEDMYRHINRERHQQVLDSCQRWARAYGPLPAANAIQLDIVGTATALLVKRDADLTATATASIDVGGSDEGQLSLDFPEMSGVTRRAPSNLSDPRNPLALVVTSANTVYSEEGDEKREEEDSDSATNPSAEMIGYNPFGKNRRGAANALSRVDLTPSLLHQMACQQLTRSTPTVHDSITKGWLRATCEVGTMTRHKEEEIMAKMLNTRSVGTSTTVDSVEIDLSDAKYRGWPVPFRYEEEYRQAVSKMSLPQLRRERHRALFGSKTDPGVVMFGGGGEGGGGRSRHGAASRHSVDPYDYTSYRSPSPGLGGLGAGGKGVDSSRVKFAADGSIALSPSPLRSSPARTGRDTRTASFTRPPPPPPSAGDVATMYRFEKDYEQWFEENIGESGRGRFNYKKQIDPDKAARMRHKALYFGVPFNEEDDGNGEEGYEFSADPQDELFDSVFGDGAGGQRGGRNTTRGNPAMKATLYKGTAAETLDKARAAKKSPYWFDHDLRDYENESDEWLATRTSGDGVIRLIGRFRKGQQLLEGAMDEIERLRHALAVNQSHNNQDNSVIRGGGGSALLTVPRLHGSGGLLAGEGRGGASGGVFLEEGQRRGGTKGLRSSLSPVRVYPRTFTTATREKQHMTRGGDTESCKDPCDRCESLQAQVNALTRRIHDLRIRRRAERIDTADHTFPDDNDFLKSDTEDADVYMDDGERDAKATRKALSPSSAFSFLDSDHSPVSSNRARVSVSPIRGLRAFPSPERIEMTPRRGTSRVPRTDSQKQQPPASGGVGSGTGGGIGNRSPQILSEDELLDLL